MTHRSLPRSIAHAGALLPATLLASGASAQLSKPFLWELGKGDKKITLFGSLHVGKNDFYPLPETVLSTAARRG